jgi:putative nucleotidyltransferase with HDIG domain
MKKILFVDDEPQLLEGLRRLLSPQRKGWDMRFATSGEAALAVMENTEIDVVVTDMRMPGMDGADLLTRVHHRYPNVMKIVLSGHFDVEAGLRAVPVAHQFLMKPCDPVKLKAAIECSSQPHNFPPDEDTRRVISAIGSLPSPPAICITLIQAIRDPDSSLGMIGEIVDRDVALSAKVLQLANSAFFSLPHTVTDVTPALAVIGIDVLKQLVLSAAILRQFHTRRPIQSFSVDEFELHSRTSAQIASYLPADVNAVSLRVMTALLHDVGKLVLASYLSEKFERACRISGVEKCPLHLAEREVFGTSHAEVGAHLLNLWGLPRAAVHAIAAHHRPAPATAGSEQGLDLMAVVHISSALAHDCFAHTELAAPLGQVDDDYLRRLGVTRQMESWRKAARDAARVSP